MQFTRLRLNGFKSFVDPTDLLISTGLTGVVGPNGCGKSNLLEALRWIMGENRPTQMRGDGMDDVIFAGTESRPTRSSATVELVVDNTDRLAPAQFNQEDKLEISRRITREVGSAYKINGKDVRARDVQMLFADASTGSHSPALVRQGQISELINAKPKARRRVLEEAAGISGLYQRRHEAELKLKGAENNLSRVDDVLDQLRSRLTTLERQAGQARRYRQIADELRRAEAVLLYLRWMAAEEDRMAADVKLSLGTKTSAEAEAAVIAARKARESADTAMPPKREEETIAAAIVQRLTIERDQLDERETRAQVEIETLAARARQLVQDLEREETLKRDAGGTIGRLEGEAAELVKALEGQEDAQAKAGDVARAAGAKLSGQETELDRLTEEAARLAARVNAAERRVEEARKADKRLKGEIEGAGHALSQLKEQISGAERSETDLSDALAKSVESARQAETRLGETEANRAAAQETEGEARAALSDTEGEVSALSAEVQGLEKLLTRDADSGAKLIDRIKVEPGLETALGAALGEELSADEARTVDASGWTELDPFDPAAPLPNGARPLGEHVEAPDLLTRRLSQTGIVAAEDGDALQAALGPGQRIVSRDGDLWRWDGYRVRAGEASSAAALRLQQRNRLIRLKDQQARAEDLKAKASDAYLGARGALDAANRDEAEARTGRRNADQAAADAARAASKAEAELGMLRSRQASQGDALAMRQQELESVANALTEAMRDVEDLGDVSEARRAVEIQRGEVDLARTAMLSARAQSDEIRRAGTARQRRLDEVGRELATWQERLSKAGDRIAELGARIADTKARQTEMSDEPALLAQRRSALSTEIETAENRRRAAADGLAEAEIVLRRTESAEREAEKIASTHREERARLEAVLDGLAGRVEDAAEDIQTELNTDPEGLRETLGDEDLPPLEAAETDVGRLRRQRDALGAVNLRAEQDAEEVRTERDGIAADKDDLEAAIAKLRRGIAELNREGRQRLLEAFEEVNSRFSNLFRHLFGGGEARLIMVESEDPLDAGLEILCQPPGKKLSTLSLLSGGEQTLTALSLIFAVFLSNPAPICVLDEVDAPLDDSNVTRFCDLLDEMRRLTETRFLIITHHAVTMSRMDRLFGVTMVERGVSQLVSVDLEKAEEMVDA